MGTARTSFGAHGRYGAGLPRLSQIDVRDAVDDGADVVNSTVADVDAR